MRLIRSIALNCNNDIPTPDLAKEVLQLANGFAFVSVDIKHQVEADEQQVNEIIAKEREYEVRLTQGVPRLKLQKKEFGKAKLLSLSRISRPSMGNHD